MRALHAEAAGLPTCIQDSALEPPPHPLSACGATSHYALPIGTPPFGVLAVMHTEARPRGFTTLCREVGLRLAESAEPLLRSALTLHELEAQLDQVGRDARMDPLTRLPNRRAWEERIDDPALARGPAGVIVLDVDGLKAANDARGHHFGDEYLQLVAATVAESLREVDFVARLGGDEFAVLLPGADEPKCAAVAKRIEEALAAPSGPRRVPPCGLGRPRDDAARALDRPRPAPGGRRHVRDEAASARRDVARGLRPAAQVEPNSLRAFAPAQLEAGENRQRAEGEQHAGNDPRQHGLAYEREHRQRRQAQRARDAGEECGAPRGIVGRARPGRAPTPARGGGRVRLDWPCASRVRTIAPSTAPRSAERMSTPRATEAPIATTPRPMRIAATPKARSVARESCGSPLLRRRCGRKGSAWHPEGCQALSASLAARAAAAAAASTVTAARAILLGRPRRGVLRPLDQLLRLDQRPVLVQGDQLQADPPAGLVDLLDDHVEHVAALDHVLDVADPARAHVRDVEQAVGALLQLDERAELGRLHDLAGVLVADLGLLGDRLWIASIADAAFSPSVA